MVWPDRSAGLVVHLNRKYSILTCHIFTRHKYMFGINFKYVKTQLSNVILFSPTVFVLSVGSFFFLAFQLGNLLPWQRHVTMSVFGPEKLRPSKTGHQGKK